MHNRFRSRRLRLPRGRRARSGHPVPSTDQRELFLVALLVDRLVERTKMDDVPVMDCPACKARLRVRAYLPPTDTLPAIAGYWCEDCQKETTLEID
jgi:hypothetical protein